MSKIEMLKLIVCHVRGFVFILIQSSKCRTCVGGWMLYQMKILNLDKELKEVCHQLIKNKDDIRTEVFLPENFFEQMFKIENKEKIDKVLITDCGEELRISLIDKVNSQLVQRLKESFVQWGAFQVDEADRVHLYFKKSG